MKKIADSILDTIGETPLVRLGSFAADAAATIYAKVEAFNPGGSVKDRVALNMVRTAEADGTLRPGVTIVEPTSGNTGVGLALVGAALGYPVVLTMPDTMSVERRKLLAALGARIVLTPGREGMKGAIAEAERISLSTPGAVILGQFTNPANPAAHFATTGPEIWDALGGRVDAFVGGVGTGGTLSGVGSYLKSKSPSVSVVAVEPEGSAVISGGSPGPHGLQGIGAGFIPATLDLSVIDRVVTVSDTQAFEAARRLARTEGILAGISSGAALAAAAMLAREPDYEGKNIVVLLPDTGERYLSTSLFA